LQRSTRSLVYEIHDAYGRLVGEGAILFDAALTSHYPVKKLDIDVSSYASGFYVLKFHHPENEDSFFVRFIKR